MEKSFAAMLARGADRPAETESSSPEKERPALEQATEIQKEISEITQGKNLADLDLETVRAVLEKYRHMENVLGIADARIEGDAQAQIERAREILGDAVFAREEIENVFGIKIKMEDVPNIPFSKEDLENAKELNQFLILRVDKAADGEPLTMVKMNGLLKGKTKDGGKLLASDDGSGTLKDDAWYKNEAFATKETPKLSWALVGKKIIPHSTSKDYFEQTERIAHYLQEDVFKGKEMPKEYRDAISEFEAAKDEIQEIIRSDWQKAAEKLEGLQITQLTRQTPVESLYDMLVYAQNKDERLLENRYTWTRRRGSDGELVRVGSFDSGGANVRSRRPDDAYGLLGVSFSRSF